MKDTIGLKSEIPSTNTSRAPIKCTYILNLNFLAQFGGELREEQTQKMRKTDQKIEFFEAARKNNETLKLRPQRAHLRHLLNVYINFQLLSSI